MKTYKIRNIYKFPVFVDVGGKQIPSDIKSIPVRAEVTADIADNIVGKLKAQFNGKLEFREV